MGSQWSQLFPPASKFTVNDIPDLTGKVMIVTGGNSGVGKEIVRELLLHDAKVYLTSRNVEKGQAAIDELERETGKRAAFLWLDLASFKSIRQASEEFLSQEKELHALYNNGGVMFLNAAPGYSDLTQEGYDVQWGTNVVGPFLLTKLLMPALIAAGHKLTSDKARVAFMSSIVQTKTILLNTTTDTVARKNMPPDQRYRQSKFANIVLANEFARRYADKGIAFMSLNPGNLKTPLQRHMNGLPKRLLGLISYPPPYGALTPLWAGTSHECASANGKYLIPWARVVEPSAESQDPELGRMLWDWLDEQVNDKSA